MRDLIEAKLRESNSDWRVLTDDEIRFLMDHAPLSYTTKQRMQEFVNDRLWKLESDPLQNPGLSRSNPGQSNLPPGLELAHGRVRATSKEGRELLHRAVKERKQEAPGACVVCSKFKEKVESGISVTELRRGWAMMTVRGIVCYPCAQKYLKRGECPYCGSRLTRRSGMMVCMACETGFRGNPGGSKAAPESVSSYKRQQAIAGYKDFNMQDPKVGWVTEKMSLPGPDEPMVWLGKMAEIVYISDKEGDNPNILDNKGDIVDGQHYVHTLKPPYPDIYMTADRRTLVIPMHKASLRIDEGWMREHDE